jgi:hypothetical protein
MSLKTIIAVVFAAAVTIAWVQSSSGQVQPVPGPGSGIVTVTGKVGIDDVVRVMPALADWRVIVGNVPDVRVVNTPAVTLTLPTFVRVGGHYEITWGPNERESIRVAETLTGAWVRTDTGGRSRWLNLALARSVEEVR